ncbi:MAG: tetratricopeptide repeat protein [Armatimonadetes bacterium]|nr:tetratricopeptide repeat protein [Armatimonadota bacterium]
MGDEKIGVAILHRRGWQRALSTITMVLSAMALVDKMLGLLWAPLIAASLAYLTGCLAALMAPRRWAVARVGAILGLTFAYGLTWRLVADPTPLVVWQQLHAGDALLEGGRREDALLIYREAERVAPRNPHVLTRLGAAYYRITDYQRAARAYEIALREAQPPLERGRRWRVLVDLGQTYWKLGRPQDALRTYQDALALGIPEEERPLMDYRLAGAYFDLRDFDRAIHHYGRVAQAGGEYEAASLYNIACAYAQKYRLAPPTARPMLVRRAVQFLREAWTRARDPADRQALLEGLAGAPEQQDPELAPIRGTKEMAALLRLIRTAEQR